MNRQQQVLEALARHGGNVSRAADDVGLSPRQVRRYRDRGVHIPSIPDADRDVSAILRARKDEFRRLDDSIRARQLIPIQMKDDKPICLVFFGDPHLDDPGTDIEAVERHAELVQETEGMYGACLGDITNNWIGRLARLYENHTVTAQEGWKLAEWFLTKVDWLYVVSGNHDLWSGHRDPVPWILEHRGATSLYDCWVRVALQFPNGREIRVNCRHEWKGSSVYHNIQGQYRAAKHGFSDHIIIGGHKHTCGYAQAVHPDPTTGIDHGRLSHLLQVATYKIHDKYAREHGFPNQHISPCACAVIDPGAEYETDLVEIYWRPEKAKKVLEAIR